jgi:hypothetical protein
VNGLDSKQRRISVGHRPEKFSRFWKSSTDMPSGERSPFRFANWRITKPFGISAIGGNETKWSQNRQEFRMQRSDVKLSNLLECFSEDTLFSLKMWAERRARRAALKAEAGKAPVDLQPLRHFLTEVEKRHDAALNHTD